MAPKLPQPSSFSSSFIFRAPAAASRFVDAYVIGLRQHLPTRHIQQLDKFKGATHAQLYRVQIRHPAVPMELLSLLERTNGTGIFASTHLPSPSPPKQKSAPFSSIRLSKPNSSSSPRISSPPFSFSPTTSGGSSSHVGEEMPNSSWADGGEEHHHTRHPRSPLSSTSSSLSSCAATSDVPHAQVVLEGRMKIGDDGEGVRRWNQVEWVGGEMQKKKEEGDKDGVEEKEDGRPPCSPSSSISSSGTLHSTTTIHNNNNSNRMMVPIFGCSPFAYALRTADEMCNTQADSLPFTRVPQLQEHYSFFHPHHQCKEQVTITGMRNDGGATVGGEGGGRGAPTAAVTAAPAYRLMDVPVGRIPGGKTPQKPLSCFTEPHPYPRTRANTPIRHSTPTTTVEVTMGSSKPMGGEQVQECISHIPTPPPPPFSPGKKPRSNSKNYSCVVCALPSLRWKRPDEQQHVVDIPPISFLSPTISKNYTGTFITHTSSSSTRDSHPPLHSRGDDGGGDTEIETPSPKKNATAIERGAKEAEAEEGEEGQKKRGLAAVGVGDSTHSNHWDNGNAGKRARQVERSIVSTTITTTTSSSSSNISTCTSSPTTMTTASSSPAAAGASSASLLYTREEIGFPNAAIKPSYPPLSTSTTRKGMTTLSSSSPSSPPLPLTPSPPPLAHAAIAAANDSIANFFRDFNFQWVHASQGGWEVVDSALGKMMRSHHPHHSGSGNPNHHHHKNTPSSSSTFPSFRQKIKDLLFLAVHGSEAAAAAAAASSSSSSSSSIHTSGSKQNHTTTSRNHSRNGGCSGDHGGENVARTTAAAPTSPSSSSSTSRPPPPSASPPVTKRPLLQPRRPSSLVLVDSRIDPSVSLSDWLMFGESLSEATPAAVKWGVGGGGECRPTAGQQSRWLQPPGSSLSNSSSIINNNSSNNNNMKKSTTPVANGETNAILASSVKWGGGQEEGMKKKEEEKMENIEKEKYVKAREGKREEKEEVGEPAAMKMMTKKAAAGAIIKDKISSFHAHPPPPRRFHYDNAKSRLFLDFHPNPKNSEGRVGQVVRLTWIEGVRSARRSRYDGGEVRGVVAPMKMSKAPPPPGTGAAGRAAECEVCHHNVQALGEKRIIAEFRVIAPDFGTYLKTLMLEEYAFLEEVAESNEEEMDVHVQSLGEEEKRKKTRLPSPPPPQKDDQEREKDKFYEKTAKKAKEEKEKDKNMAEIIKTEEEAGGGAAAPAGRGEEKSLRFTASTTSSLHHNIPSGSSSTHVTTATSSTTRWERMTEETSETNKELSSSFFVKKPPLFWKKIPLAVAETPLAFRFSSNTWWTTALAHLSLLPSSFSSSSSSRWNQRPSNEVVHEEREEEKGREVINHSSNLLEKFYGETTPTTAAPATVEDEGVDKKMRRSNIFKERAGGGPQQDIFTIRETSSATAATTTPSTTTTTTMPSSCSKHTNPLHTSSFSPFYSSTVPSMNWKNEIEIISSRGRPKKEEEEEDDEDEEDEDEEEDEEEGPQQVETIFPSSQAHHIRALETENSAA